MRLELLVLYLILYPTCFIPRSFDCVQLSEAPELNEVGVQSLWISHPVTPSFHPLTRLDTSHLKLLEHQALLIRCTHEKSDQEKHTLGWGSDTQRMDRVGIRSNLSGSVM